MFSGRRAKKAIKSGNTQELLALLDDPDSKVRANAANACMEIPPGEAEPAVVAALLRLATGPEAEVRGQAILALGSIRVAEAHDLFLSALPTTSGS